MDNWKRLSFRPWKELKELQSRRLCFFITRQLYPFSPYYRALFDKHKIKPRYIRSAEDLRIIPFTSKEDLLPKNGNSQHLRNFILQPDEKLIRKYWPKNKLLCLALQKAVKGKEHVKERLNREFRPVFLTATTGTTEQPVSFLYTNLDISNLQIYGYRLLEVFAAQGDDRAVNIFPYAPHLAFWQTVFAGIAHNNFVLSTGGGKTMGTQGNIDAISKVRPNIIIGEPNFLYHVVRTAKEAGRDFSLVRKVVLGASRVPLGFKEKMASLLAAMGAKDISILGTYGFTEAKCAWGECPTALNFSSGYHTYPDREIFEVVDGELVYTDLDARGSCVLRYRTGDIVKGGIIYERCPHCKRTVPRISSDISRAVNIKDLQLSKVKGTLVNLNNLSVILESAKEVEEWQIEIRKKDNDPFEVDELLIYLSIRQGAEAHILKEEIRQKILAAAEIAPNDIIILSHKEMIERVGMEQLNKAKRIVDARPKA